MAKRKSKKRAKGYLLPKYQNRGEVKKYATEPIKETSLGDWWEDFEKSDVGKFVDAKGLRKEKDYFLGLLGYGDTAKEGRRFALDAAAMANPIPDFINAVDHAQQEKYLDAGLYAGFGLLPFAAKPIVDKVKPYLKPVVNSLYTPTYTFTEKLKMPFLKEDAKKALVKEKVIEDAIDFTERAMSSPEYAKRYANMKGMTKGGVEADNASILKEMESKGLLSGSYSDKNMDLYVYKNHNIAVPDRIDKTLPVYEDRFNPIPKKTSVKNLIEDSRSSINYKTGAGKKGSYSPGKEQRTDVTHSEYINAEAGTPEDLLDLIIHEAMGHGKVTGGTSLTQKEREFARDVFKPKGAVGKEPKQRIAKEKYWQERSREAYIRSEDEVIARADEIRAALNFEDPYAKITVKDLERYEDMVNKSTDLPGVHPEEGSSTKQFMAAIDKEKMANFMNKFYVAAPIIGVTGAALAKQENTKLQYGGEIEKAQNGYLLPKYQNGFPESTDEYGNTGVKTKLVSGTNQDTGKAYTAHAPLYSLPEVTVSDKLDRTNPTAVKNWSEKHAPIAHAVRKGTDEAAENINSVADFLPGYGEVRDLAYLGNSIYTGDNVGTGIGLAALAIPGISPSVLKKFRSRFPRSKTDSELTDLIEREVERDYGHLDDPYKAWSDNTKSTFELEELDGEQLIGEAWEVAEDSDLHQRTAANWETGRRAELEKQGNILNESGIKQTELESRIEPKHLPRAKSMQNFQNTLLHPDGKLIRPPSNKIIETSPTKMHDRHYVEEFNRNIDYLNDIIKSNNKSGIDYNIENLGYYDNLITNSNIGGQHIGVNLKPGQWKGKVMDIPSARYQNSIPGIQMTAISDGVFGDGVARRGTGLYKSINQYLKEFDLGRVASGRSGQTESSLGLWENAVKNKNASGFYETPYSISGIMYQNGGPIPKYQTEGRIKTYKDPSEFIKASKAFEDSAFAAHNQHNIFEDKVQSGDYDVYPPAKQSVADPKPIVDYDEAYNKALPKDEAEIAYGNITAGNTLGYSNYRGINPVGYLQAMNNSTTGQFTRIYPMYKPPVVTPVLAESIEPVPVKSSTQLQTRPLQEDRLTPTAIAPSIGFPEKTEYTAAGYPMIDTKARREGRVGNTVVPRGDFNKGNNEGRVEVFQNGGSLPKYQDGDDVLKNTLNKNGGGKKKEYRNLNDFNIANNAYLDSLGRYNSNPIDPNKKIHPWEHDPNGYSGTGVTKGDAEVFQQEVIEREKIEPIGYQESTIYAPAHWIDGEYVPAGNRTQHSSVYKKPTQKPVFTGIFPLEPSIKPSIEFLEKTEYTAADYPMVDAKAKREVRPPRTHVPKGYINRGDNKGRIEINQNGGSVKQDSLYTSLLNAFQNGGEIKEDYNIKRAEELGYTRDETGHMPSVDHETGMWLKSKEHPTAHKEYISMMLNPDIKAVVNPEGYFEENQLQYIPRKENGGEILPEELPHKEIVSFPTEREPYVDPNIPKYVGTSFYTNLYNTPVPKSQKKLIDIWKQNYKTPKDIFIKNLENHYDINAFGMSKDWETDFEKIEDYRKPSHPMLGDIDPDTDTFIPSERNVNTNEEIAEYIAQENIPVNFKKVERIPINPDGFAPGSATEFADKVIIPGNNITMKDMQEPILANGEMLMPGDEAQFDTDYVVEEKLPKAQDGLKVEGQKLSKKEVDDLKNFVEDDTNFVQEYPYLLPEAVIEDKLDRTNRTAVRNWSREHDPIAYAAREATDEAAPYVGTGLGVAFAPAGASLLGAGARGLAAAGEATYGALSPYASAAWNTNIPSALGMSSVPGATVGNLINAGFGTHGATNILPDALELLTNPLSLENLANVGIDVLEMAPLVGPGAGMLREGVGALGKVGKSKTIPLTHSKKGGFKGDFLKDKTLIGEGSEFTVYKDTKGNVFKIGEAYNSPETFNPRIEQKLKLNEIGGVPTELVGHWKSPNGTMNPIFKQPFIKGKKATQKEIDTYFKNKGFNKIKDGTYSNSKHTISDIDPDNVIIESNNKVNIIDAFIEPTSAAGSAMKTSTSKTAEAALLKEYLPTGMGIKGHKPGDALLGNYKNVLDKGYDIHDVRLKYHNNMFVDFDEMAMLQKFGKGNKKNYERANTEDILGKSNVKDGPAPNYSNKPSMQELEEELFGKDYPKIEVPIKSEPTVKSSDAATTGTNLSKGEQNIIPVKKLEIPSFFSKPFKRTAKSRASDKWMEDWFYHPETKKRFINYGGTEKEWEAILNTLENPLKSNYKWGKNQPGGVYSKVFKQASVPLDATVGVGVHENTHKTGILVSKSNPILHKLWNDFTEAVKLVPTEAYPEIMRFRQMLGLKPGQRLGLETMKKNLHLLSDGYMMNAKIKDHKKLLDIINKAPALLPPAAIIGAGSAKSKD